MKLLTENATPDFNLLHDYIQGKLSNDANKFKIESIQPEKVMQYLKTLNSNKGTGLNGLTPKSLKLAAHIIYLPLSHIVNMSFKYHTFPKILKQSRIRPISIIPVISKIIEKHVAQQINTYLQEQNLLLLALDPATHTKLHLLI